MQYALEPQVNIFDSIFLTRPTAALFNAWPSICPYISLVQGKMAQGNPIFREHTSWGMDTPYLKYSYPTSLPLHLCVLPLFQPCTHLGIKPLAFTNFCKKKLKLKKIKKSKIKNPITASFLWEWKLRTFWGSTIQHSTISLHSSFPFFHVFNLFPFPVQSNSVWPSISQDRLGCAVVQNNPQTSHLIQTFIWEWDLHWCALKVPTEIIWA